MANDATVCIANIGLRGRRMRTRFGAALFVVGAAVLVCLLASGAPRAYRAAVFLPLWLSALGVFQAREKT